MRNHGTGTDDTSTANANAFQDNGTRTNKDIVLDKDRRSLKRAITPPQTWIECVRVAVRNQATRADQNIVPDFNPLAGCN